jgi:hypothetical protein
MKTKIILTIVVEVSHMEVIWGCGVCPLSNEEQLRQEVSVHHVSLVFFQPCRVLGWMEWNCLWESFCRILRRVVVTLTVADLKPLFYCPVLLTLTYFRFRESPPPIIDLLTNWNTPRLFLPDSHE